MSDIFSSEHEFNDELMHKFMAPRRRALSDIITNSTFCQTLKISKLKKKK